MNPRRALQRRDDLIHHAAGIPTNLAAPEAKNPKSVPVENTVANGIMLDLKIVAMLAAVDLDHQAARKAGEVEIVAAKRELAADVEAAFAQAFQPRPEQDFRLAHVAAKFAGALDF
ncbi:MAG: hypothetical protein JWP49_1383 [Phenylobacterium sp.]|nr:hypothetical protein [Phenylobacterium sp.]